MLGRMARFLPKLRWMALGVVLCLGAGAQDVRRLTMQTWSTEEGLPQNSVHAIAQTSDGFIWAGTEGGLVRFDGARFDVFGRGTDKAFTSDDICCLVAGPDGGLWVGTSDGVVEFRHGKFVRGGAALPVASSEWSWTANEVVLQRGAARQVWDAGRELPAGRVATVYGDRSGRAWVGMNSGLVVIDPAGHSVTPVEELKGSSTLSVFEDREGSFWVGTESSGLHLLRQQKFRGISGLAGKAITSVAGGNDGTVWVGTREDGVFRVVGDKVDAPVAVRALTSGVVLALAPGAGGGVWVGTPDGLNRVDKTGRVRQITTANGLPDDYVRSLASEPDGGVWVGTRHGLVHVCGDRIDTLTSMDGLGGDLIGALLREPDGALWVATSGGLSMIGADGKIRNFATGDGLATPIVSALALDRRQRMWAVTDDGTVSWFDGGRFRAVTRLLADAGSGVQGLWFDGAGSLWVRMDRAIERIGAVALAECVKRSPCSLTDDAIVRYGAADGLRNDEVVPRAMALPWMAADGELWFPTRSGVAIVQTGAATATASPPVVVERLLVDDAAVELGGEPQIASGRARLTMEYAGLSYLAPTEMRYRYRLDGFDTGWTEAGNRRSATYTNLPPGWYTFRVEARNNDGAWSPAGAELRFRIVPPIYRRWWFLMLVALAIGAAVYGVYLLRLRRLRTRFDAVLAERNRMAREIHDTLTQDFVSTSLQLDIVAQQLKRGQVERAIEQVRQARQLVTEGIAEARRSIWELRANTSQDTLPTRLTRLTEREAFAGIHPEVKVRGAYRALEPRVEREILRVTNEALMNAMKHAAPQHTTVDLYYSSEALLLTIKDDGAGFDVDNAAAKEGHYGLVGMRERASIIDGTLEILSAPGQGTTILLRVPLALEMKER